MKESTLSKAQPHAYRLMTYNIGGGRKRYVSQKQLILKVIQDVSPDILVVQEAIRIIDAEGNWHDDLDEIGQAIDINAAHIFFPTLTMQEHMHPNNKNMVGALFRDRQDWQQGNAIISRWPFHALGEPERVGKPRHIPLNQSHSYEGSRDTEPRAAIIARIGRAPHYPIVVGVHLSTLVGERGNKIILGKPERARQMRESETRCVIELLREDVLDQKQLVFLLGDFNATIEEASIQHIIEEGNFVAATPEHGMVSTHPKVGDAIDHVFLFPQDRIASFRSYVVDSDIAQKASDHLPIVSEVLVV